MTKDDNIILRVDERTHNIIKIKSNLFGFKKSEYLRHCGLGFMGDKIDNNNFKKLLKLYQESDEGRKQVVDILFEYYRRSGYPHYNFNDEKKIRIMNSLMKTKIKTDEDKIKQNSVGINLANYFHPHMIKASYGIGKKLRTPQETFENDDYLKDCINRILELKWTPNHSNMRRILRTRNKTRGITNFSPIFAKFICNQYVPENGIVLDPCAGFSSRFLGCISTNKNIFYHGIDPDGDTAIGNMKCASFFKEKYDMFGERIYKFKYKFDLGYAENVMLDLKEDNYDLIFSSFPYFSLEDYSFDPSQSNHKYPEYQEWLEKFVYVIINQSKRILKKEGKLAINIKNVKQFKIADDILNYCKKEWKIEKIWKIVLPNNEFLRVGKNEGHFEPIFVFRK